MLPGDLVSVRHQDVPAAMADLASFARRTDLPVLVHAALAHAHLETIHPFPDGNGRTGRALLQAMLRAGGLTRTSTPPVSAGLLTAPDAYVAALGAYREGEVDAIVLAVADAALVGIANGRVLVQDLRTARTRWDDAVRARRDAMVWRVADLLVRTPVVTAAVVAGETGATSANVHRALRTLVEAGMLTELGGRRRGRFWQAREVLDALDAFAERAGRPRVRVASRHRRLSASAAAGRAGAGPPGPTGPGRARRRRPGRREPRR